MVSDWKDFKLGVKEGHKKLNFKNNFGVIELWCVLQKDYSWVSIGKYYWVAISFL